MLTFMTTHIADIVIGLFLAVILFWIVRKLLHDKKQGKPTCGGNCGCCGAKGLCHEEKKEK